MIANITSPAGLTYLFNAAYSIGKAGLDRMTHDLGFELIDHGVAVVGMRPGPTRTEFIEDQAAAGTQVAMEGAETPIYVGRGVAALRRYRVEEEKISTPGHRQGEETQTSKRRDATWEGP